MLTGDVMQTKVVTVSPRTTLREAIGLARARGIRHLPVVDGGRLVGIVSDRDLKRVMASPASDRLDQVAVEDVMTRAVLTVSPAVPVEEAARRMMTEKVSALPAIEGGALAGILTETDVVELFVRAMGADEPSSRLDVALGPGRSALADIIQTVESAGASVASVVTLGSRRGGREAIVRIATIDPRPALAALHRKGYATRDAAVGR